MDKDNAQADLAHALKVLVNMTTINTSDEQRLQELRRTLNTCEKYWPIREEHKASYPSLVDEVVMVCVAWLEQAADLLAHGRPPFLNDQYEKSFKPMLNSVLTILLENGHPAPIAMWHLRTQGLRAQRQAIAAGRAHDPDLEELDRLYNMIEVLDRKYLGHSMAQGQTVILSSPDENRRHANRVNTGDADHQGQGMQRDRLWAELLVLENRLRLHGQLPDTKRLDLDHLGKCLAAMQTVAVKQQTHSVALLLLMPKDDKSLVAICVQAADPAGAAGLSYQADWRQVPMVMNEEALRTCLDRLTKEEEARTANGGRAVRGIVNRSEGGAGSAQTAQTALSEADLAVLRCQWMSAPDVLRPMLADLRAQGITEVHVVPGGDLHLAPWAASLDEGSATGLRVRQFPTTASWWRVMGGEVSEPAPTHWASLAFDATNTTKPALKWVGVEARALQQIWGNSTSVAQDRVQARALENPHWPPATQVPPPIVQAMVGMGHGGAQDDNWALAGMFTGTEPDSPGSNTLRDRYFTGLDLHLIKEVRYLVMSCCVLGRLRDSQGEPIGMPTLALAFKARMACGAMVPIPDFEGALFSMALHFAWAVAEKTALAQEPPVAMDWSAVFHATRREVMARRWPDGFGEWLKINLFQLAFNDIGDGLHDPRYFEWDLIDPVKGPAACVAQNALTPSPYVQAVATMFTCLG